MSGGALAASSEPVNGVVVIVNKEVITWKDVQQYIAPALEVLQRTYANQPAVLGKKIEEAQRDGTEQLVERKLILHEFKTAGYNLPESIIEDRVQARIRDRFGDRHNATHSLNAQGVTYETFRQQVRDDFIITVMRSRNISQELIISPHKIEKYYAEKRDQFKVEDQVKVRLIELYQTPASPAGAAKRLADELLAKLNEGVPFAELASIHSEGSKRTQGGDWGWVDRAVLRKEVSEVAFSLKPGQRSGVVQTPDGSCYIILVEDIRAHHTKTLSEVRDEIEKSLLVQEQTRLNRQWIDRLKAKTFVRYF